MSAQVFVDTNGCALAVADAVNDEARAESAIATGKDSRSGGHQGFVDRP